MNIDGEDRSMIPPPAARSALPGTNPAEAEPRPADDARAAAAALAASARVLVRHLAGLVLRVASEFGRRCRLGLETVAGRLGSSLPAAGRPWARSAAPPPPQSGEPRLRPAAPLAASRGSGRRRWLVPAALAVVLAPLVPLAYVLFCLAGLPIDGGLDVDPKQRAMVMESADGSTLATRGTFRGAKLERGDLPPYLGKAVVAIEDRRFYDHHGIDPRGTLRALWRDARAGGASREGGSTLTQQLVRLTYLSADKTLRRKVQEAVLSLWMEAHLSKDEILLRYLNTAYFGAGSYGADAAAHRYFGKNARDLTLGECAMLAGLVRAPSQLAPTRNFGGARERADTVLQAMADTGAITAQQADAGRREQITLKTPPETPPGTNYFIDMVAAAARGLPNGAAGDITLRTTLNQDLQRLAEGVVERRLDAEGQSRKASQAALVALRPDGAIVALVGGRDYEASQFDHATQAKRQPGSLFKLFVYLTAFGTGFTPGSTMVDQPIRIGDWTPVNAEPGFRGRMDLRSAFAESVNTVAAQLGQAVGIPSVIDTAHRLGIVSDLPNVPSLVLGTAEVTLMEMTRAYANVAANTTGLDPYSVAELRGDKGQALYTRPPRMPGNAIGPARDLMVDAMQAVVDEGTGKAAHPTGFEAAGKTGTSQDYRDAWFVGFTPQLTVGVWVGNDDGSPMNRVVGGDLPAKMFHDFVDRAEPLLRPTPQPAAAASASVASASVVPADAQPAAAARTPEGVRGTPAVVDTGTLAFRDGRVFHLQGVVGEGGRLARQLARFVRRRDVTCTPLGQDTARCRIDGEDLSALVLSAGGARAADGAPPELLAAEDQARSGRLGIWRHDQ